MRERSDLRALAAMCAPIALQNLISAAVNSADALMLTAAGQDALSAVTLAGQAAFVLSLFYLGLSSGASILAAQYWGRRDAETVSRVQGIATRFSLLISALFFAVGLTIPTRVMRLFTPSSPLIALGADYLRALCPSFLCMGISQMLLAVCKGLGHTRLAAGISAVCLLANIAMNAVALYVLFPGRPHEAVQGVAAATALARLLELALCAIAIRLGKGVPLRRAHLLHTPPELRGDFLRCALPVLGNYLVWGGALTAMSAIMGRMGSDMVSANSLATSLRNLVTVGCSGLASGGGVLLGQRLGGDDMASARRLGRTLFAASLATGALAGLLLIALRAPFMRLSHLSDGAMSLLGQMLWINALYCVGKSFNMSMVSGVFCAGGDTRFGLICDAIAMWGVILPLGALAAFALRLPPLCVYAILCADEFIKMPAVWLRFRKYRWLVNLTRGAQPRANVSEKG